LLQYRSFGAHDLQTLGVGWLICSGVQPLHSGNRVLRGKVAAAHRHGNGLVAWKLLHGTDVQSGHYQTAGERVPQTVPREALQARGLHGWLEPPAGSVSSSTEHSFSNQHLRAASLFADEAQTVESAINQPDEAQVSRHRANVTASIFSAVAFLEGSINEWYLSAIDRDRAKLPTFDEKVFQLFGQFWECKGKLIVHNGQ
jgi:hypothetical protein